MGITDNAQIVASMSERATPDAVDLSESLYFYLLFGKKSQPASSKVRKVIGTSFSVDCVVNSIEVFEVNCGVSFPFDFSIGS